MSLTASAVIFDLDGTLIASLEDLADAVNSALEAHSFPLHSLEPYKYFVGDGMENLVRRALPEGTPMSVVGEVYAMAKREYGIGWARKTRPYEGILPMLEALDGRTIPMAVLTNKPHVFTKEMVEYFFPDVPFKVVQGSPEGGKAKPDPTLALGIADHFGLEPGRVVFIGDSCTDMDTAVNAGMVPVGVLWGFRPERELLDHGAMVILSKPQELFDRVTFSA